MKKSQRGSFGIIHAHLATDLCLIWSEALAEARAWEGAAHCSRIHLFQKQFHCQVISIHGCLVFSSDQCVDMRINPRHHFSQVARQMNTVRSLKILILTFTLLRPHLFLHVFMSLMSLLHSPMTLSTGHILGVLIFILNLLYIKTNLNGTFYFFYVLSQGVVYAAFKM